MKLLPILIEQSITHAISKLNYFIQNQLQVIQDTNQDLLSFVVYIVGPSFSSINNVPTTISLSSLFAESSTLINQKVNVYINYLATSDDMLINVPETMNYSFLPENWNVFMYVPLDVLDEFRTNTDRIDNLGGLIYLRELNQSVLDSFVLKGFKNFSLLGRHIIKPGEVTEAEISNIINIINNNEDCNFVVNSEMDEVVTKIQDLPNVQICQNNTYWSSKI